MEATNTQRILRRAFVMLVSVAAGLVTSKMTATAVAQDQRASVWDGVYTDAQADRGHSLYDRQCGLCHGRYLEGVLAVPPEPAWHAAPPLTGWEFRQNWNRMSLGDLFERQRISMPQQAPGSLGRQQTADVLAYVLQQNGYPSGRREISGERGALDSITIEWW
jgi:cytochrome c